MALNDRMARLEDRVGISDQQRRAATVSRVMNAVLRDPELRHLARQMSDRLRERAFYGDGRFELPDDAAAAELARRFEERLETLKGQNS